MAAGTPASGRIRARNTAASQHTACGRAPLAIAEGIDQLKLLSHISHQHPWSSVEWHRRSLPPTHRDRSGRAAGALPKGVGSFAMPGKVSTDSMPATARWSLMARSIWTGRPGRDRQPARAAICNGGIYVFGDLDCQTLAGASYCDRIFGCLERVMRFEMRCVGRPAAAPCR